MREKWGINKQERRSDRDIKEVDGLSSIARNMSSRFAGFISKTVYMGAT